MPENRQLAAETDDGTDAPFAFSDLANRAVLAVTLAIPAILLALLLAGAARAVAIGGILLVVAWFVIVFRFEVRPRERTVTIRWLWLGLLEQRAVTYSFSDVRGLRYAPFGWGEDGYRWEFRDGATYHLMAPIDVRLLRWFRGESNKSWEAHENWFQKLALLAVFLIGTTVTLSFDVVAGRDVMRQVRSRSYLPVAGHILRSSVKPCDDGSWLWNYEPVVQYSFVVNGIAYTGTRYRYSPQSMWWRFSESTARALLPKGETATVYYNPLDPADAILSPGLGGLDVFALLCLLPLNAVVLIGAIACFRLARYRAFRGVPVWDDGRVVRAGLRRWSPAAAASLAAGAMAFVLVFALGLPTGGNPSVAIASLGWLIVLCVAGLAWRASVRALAKGTRDLVIDQEQRTLTLPVDWGRKEPLTIPWESLSGIEVEDTQDKSVTVHYTVVAAVTHADGTTTRERLTGPLVESSANALAAWVRGMLYPYQPGASPLVSGPR